MLTVDSIMRGPKLVGNPPGAIRWSRGSDKVYFSWQKPEARQSSTWEVGRDGTGLRELSADEARKLDEPVAGRLDRAGRRALVAENGDIVIVDVQTGDRRALTRTAAAESSPRWARKDTAVTFVRDGDLFLLSLDAGTGAALVQLTDVVEPPAAGAVAAAPAAAKAAAKAPAAATAAAVTAAPKAE